MRRRAGGGRAAGPPDRRRAGTDVAGRGRRRVPRRPVGGVPHLLQPMAGRRPAPPRPPILTPGAARPGDVVGRYQEALEAGDADAIVQTFAADGYFREPIGLHCTPTAAPVSCARTSPGASAQAAPSGCRTGAVIDDRRALRPGIQLRPLGQPRSTRRESASTNGAPDGLLARPPSRRRRSTCSHRTSQMSAAPTTDTAVAPRRGEGGAGRN